MDAFDPRKNPKANENLGMLLAVVGAAIGAAVTNVDPIWTLGLAIVFAAAGYLGAPYLVEETAPTPKKDDGHAKKHGDEHHDNDGDEEDEEGSAPTPPTPPAKAKPAAKAEPEEDPEVTRLKAQIAAKDAENEVLRQGIQKVAAAKTKDNAKDGEKPQGGAPKGTTHSGGGAKSESPKALPQETIELPTPENVEIRLRGLRSALETHLQKGVTRSNIIWLKNQVASDRYLLRSVPEEDWEDDERVRMLRILQDLQGRINALNPGDKAQPEAPKPPQPPVPASQPPLSPPPAEEEGSGPKEKVVELLENPIVQAAATAAATTLVKAAKKKLSKKA